MKLTNDQMNRARGVLLGTAVGDVLGVPYEFKGPQNFGPRTLGMPGGGPFKFDAGEWSDDTSMTLGVAQAAYDGHDLTTPKGLDAVALGFLRWKATGPKDMGGQVSSALGGVRPVKGVSHTLLVKSAARYRALPGGSGGNGSLMRTAPVALRHLKDARKMTYAAQLVSGLTHADPDAFTACVLWCHGIRSAVLTGDPVKGVQRAVEGLPVAERDRWSTLVGEAHSRWPQDFPNNGWVVTAFQAALSAVTLGVEAQSFETGITHAVGCGHDTDTVGAIAGAMLGATFGYSGIRRAWRKQVWGWPGVKGSDLPRIAQKIVEVA